MSYWARERQVLAKMFTFVFAHTHLASDSHKKISQILQILQSTMASTLESVVETPETVTEDDVNGTFDGQPVKAHKSKRDRLKAGRASMIPPVLVSPSILARLDFAVDAPPLPPAPLPLAGRNATCLSTFLGKNQHPPAWSGADQGSD
jgi:hypothetical protein